jgi:type VI secretion system secreted protein VgrG
MFGTIARYVSLKIVAALVVAATLPVGLVAASALTSHPATPGHTDFTTPNGIQTNAEPTETPEPTDTPEATETPAAAEAPDPTETPGAMSADKTDARPTDNHGYLVSQAAHDTSSPGGKNDNHGGSVSEVARGDHGPCGTNPPGESGDHCPFPTPTPTLAPAQP